MPTETDLPCPDCGAELADRSVDASALPGPTTGPETVTVAECPDCRARFYPERTLVRLFSDDREPGQRGT